MKHKSKIKRMMNLKINYLLIKDLFYIDFGKMTLNITVLKKYY